MKNIAMLSIVVAIVLVAGFFIYGYSQNAPQTSSVETGDAQQITLGMRNANYYPNTITVKANQPVELTLDNTVGGCFRTFTIRDLGVSQVSRNAAEKIVFTPSKTGTFTFACGMGMGYGKIIVE